MAYKTVATRWLLSKKDLLAASFVEHKDNLNILSNMTDIEVKITASDVVFSGRGTDSIGDITLEKASSDAIERWCCHLLGISTVGCAIHSVREQAATNARNEFLERHFFDQYVSQSASPHILKSEQLEADAVVNYYEIAKCDVGLVVLAMIFDFSEPICLGLSLESDIDLGYKKAAVEALRNYSVYKTDKDYFHKKVATDRNLWCCDPELLRKIANTSSPPIGPGKLIEFPKISSHTQSVSDIVNIQDCPLYFSRTVTVGTL